MSKHLCVYFDDGDLEPVCACGERLVVLTDEHGVEAVGVADDGAGDTGARAAA